MSFLTYEGIKKIFNKKYGENFITTPYIDIEEYSRSKFNIMIRRQDILKKIDKGQEEDDILIAIKLIKRITNNPSKMFDVFSSDEIKKMYDIYYNAVYDICVIDYNLQTEENMEYLRNIAFLALYDNIDSEIISGAAFIWIYMGVVGLVILAIILVELHIFGIIVSLIFILLFDTRYKKSKSILYVLFMPLLGWFYFPIRLIDYIINKK